jgi:hypothetical protein
VATSERRFLRSSRLAPIVVVAVASIAGGCRAGDDEAAATGCASTVRDASLAVEVDDQVRLLDQALVRCRSLQELTGEMARYPGITGYDVATFVQLRCAKVSDESVRSSPACASVSATTSIAAQAPAEVVFVGDTLDGRRIEIRPDADTPFVGQVPQSVQQTVDIAVEAGCAGVIAQRDMWASRVDDPVIGDEASVYANHAQNVANYIGCESTPISVPG